MNKLYSLITVLIFIAIPLNAQVLPPSEDPENWLLAFVDVETTGLVPGHHEMIDIGIVILDIGGSEIDRLFIRIMPPHPERISEGAAIVNGFSLERWQKLQAVSVKAAVDSLISFHQSVTDGKNVLMVAYNCSFDAAFLDHLFRGAGKSWRELYYYYILDIPSMAWGLGLQQLFGTDVANFFGIPDEPRTPNEHTGITGADLNIRIYRELLKYHAQK